MKLFYGDLYVGEITTNHSMSIEEACEILEVDMETQDEEAIGYDLEELRLED